MKKRSIPEKMNWMRILALFLAAVLSIGLVSCKKEEGDGVKGEDKTEQSASDPKKNPNGEMAKQYVFSHEDMAISDLGDDVYVSGLGYRDGKVYAVAEVYRYGQGTLEDGDAVPVPLVEEVAEEEVTVDADVTVDAEVVEEDGGYSHKFLLVSFPLDGGERQVVPLEGLDLDDSNAWVNRWTVASDGCLYGVVDEYYEDYSDPDNPIYEERLSLESWNLDGTFRWTASLDEGINRQEEYVYMIDMFVANDGTVQAFMNGNKIRALTIGADGTVQGESGFPEDLFENLNSMFLNPDGDLMLITANEEWTKMYYSTFDMETGESTDKVELPGNVMMFSLYPGTDGNLIMSNNTGLFKLNLEDNSIEQFFSFINSDMSSNYLGQIVVLDDDHFIATFNDEDYRTVMGYFTKVEPEEIPDKTVLVIGCNYLDSNLRRRVVDFNKSSDRYRFTIMDYSQYSTMEDYMASYTQLNNDIISGKMPDILAVDYNMPIQNYISKGLIADVGKLIENDPELSQVEYVQNVFDAYSVDGKLYYVVPTFSVSTVLGKTSLVGDRQGWNMEEFNELLAQLPEGTKGFSDMTRDSFLYSVMNYCGTEYVNTVTGECTLDSDEFIKVLEYAKTMPVDYEYDYSDDNFDYSYYENRYRNNNVLLMPMTIYDFRNLNRTMVGSFGEAVTPIGFPTEDRNGSLVRGDSMYVLSSRSTDLDGAWQFVRYYLTEEYQSDTDWGMPTIKKLLEEQAKSATEKQKFEDENGQMVEQDDFYWLGDEQIVIEPMSQEVMEKMLAFVESVDRTSFSDDEIVKIIQEEAAPFFEGQKTAEEVAQIIQSRVWIYVNEKM